jgi:hypothetical protein
MKVCKGFFVVFLSCLALACGGDKPGKNGVLPVNKMKTVMWDVMQVDEYANTFLVKDSSINIPVASGKMYQQVFGLHKISEKEFYTSFNFYRDHPNYFKILIDSISAYGNRERDSGYNRSRMTLTIDSAR